MATFAHGRRRRSQRDPSGFRWRTVLISTFALLTSATAGLIAGMVVTYTRQLPSVEELSNYSPALITKVFARDGRLIAQFGAEKRLFVTLDQISDDFTDAVIAVEDERFYEHRGVDMYGIARAGWADVRARRLAQGASTITQQLARNLFLTKEKRWSRKVKEALLAVRIEERYSKNEILEMYVNQIFFGSNAYGVEAAALIHFGKPASELDLAEAALLAGLPQGPSRLSPFKNMTEARERMAVVLRSMERVGYITGAERQAALQAPIQLNRSSLSRDEAPYFLDHVRRKLESEYGQDRVWRGGLRVHTTLDLDMQKIGERALDEGLSELNLKIRKSWEAQENEGPAPSVQGGLVALVPNTGEIVAMVGGTDYQRNQWNRTTQAKRQPGSAFKPILFAVAFSQQYTPATCLADSPIIKDRYSPTGPWIPENYEERYYGPTSLAEALIHSRNVVAVKLLEEVGLDPVIVLASRILGVEAARFYAQRNLTIGLGSVAMTPLEVASGYSVFANRGVRVGPGCIREVRASNGDLIGAPPRKEEIVLSPQVAYVVTDVLRKVMSMGTGRPAYMEDRPSAGKTGTTDECVNAWFVGYTPDLCCAVYVGFDERIPMGKHRTGGRVAAPIWKRFMEEALEDVPAAEFPVPMGITFATIDGRSGQLASEASEIRFKQAFIAGTEPVDEYDPQEAHSRPRPGWVP